MAPVRFRILGQLQGASRYGLSAGRIAHVLRLRPSTLAYHLDALERAGFTPPPPPASAADVLPRHREPIEGEMGFDLVDRSKMGPDDV